MSKKDTVRDFLVAALSQDVEPMRALANGYIQHNPFVPTGLESFIQALPLLQKDGIIVETVRIFEDENFVFLHNNWHNAMVFGADKMISFDVFRLDENDKIVEHWDAFTPVLAETASGRSQIEGPTEAVDLDKTQENKALVKAFIEDVLIGQNISNVGEYVSAQEYAQHNPMLKDGLAGLTESLRDVAPAQGIKLSKLHKVMGEGNFVLTVSEGEMQGKQQVFYDLFRVDNGKLVEHWDVVQEVPTEGMANDNGMFGY